MLDDPGLAAWLSLTQIEGLGNSGLRSLLAEFQSPEAILAAGIPSLQRFVKPGVAARISQGINSAYIHQVEQWLSEGSNSVLTIADSAYPLALANIPDPPVLLYLKGNPALLHNSCLAVVGSRNATPQGKRNAESFAGAASRAGLSVVSGLALGIDAAAHTGGLEGAASSIAVVGTGLDRIYPAANRELAHKLAAGGLIISEFPLGTPPVAGNFPRRNRIISGLSLGCLVVEASVQSGSLITARLAIEQGREVFAIPGSIHSPHSKGCHLLIKQGAKLVEDLSDILDELRIEAPAIQPLENTPAEIAGAGRAVLVHLGNEAMDMSTLSEVSGLTIKELSPILLQLELDGQIAVAPGGMYQRIT